MTPACGCLDPSSLSRVAPSTPVVLGPHTHALQRLRDRSARLGQVSRHWAERAPASRVRPRLWQRLAPQGPGSPLSGRPFHPAGPAWFRGRKGSVLRGVCPRGPRHERPGRRALCPPEATGNSQQGPSAGSSTAQQLHRQEHFIEPSCGQAGAAHRPVHRNIGLQKSDNERPFLQKQSGLHLPASLYRCCCCCLCNETSWGSSLTLRVSFPSGTPILMTATSEDKKIAGERSFNLLAPPPPP